MMETRYLITLCVHFAVYSQLLPLHSMDTNLQSVFLFFENSIHLHTAQTPGFYSMDTHIVIVTLMKMPFWT